MESIQAAKHIANELLNNQSKLVILSGSTARGKENPNDLDISAVFPKVNPLLDSEYRKELINRLQKECGWQLHLIDYNESFIDSIIEQYIENPRNLCWDLNYICLDNVWEQWKGWPLAWIFGERARKTLKPYGCFQDKFIVLEGQDYLDELRKRIKPALERE